MMWVDKVWDWEVDGSVVVFYNKRGKEIKRVRLDDVVRAYLYVESDEW